MNLNEDNDVVARLKKRLERERRARNEAESIAETVSRELYALNQMKSEFIAIVSHELRTPLTSIVGFTTALQSRPELLQRPELLVEALDAIGRNAERLSQLIDQLLSTSLFQTLDHESRLQRFAFHEMIERLSDKIDLGSVVLELDIPDDLPPLESDPDLVFQALRNLVDNAIKFSPEGGSIAIGARAEGSTFRFWVEDQGIGMASEDIEHAFEPFWQADPSNTRQFGGVGLGLHMTKLIAHILGGEISVESGPETGSRLEVSLRSGTVSEARAG